MLKRIVRLTGTQMFSAGSLGVIYFQPNLVACLSLTTS